MRGTLVKNAAGPIRNRRRRVCGEGMQHNQIPTPPPLSRPHPRGFPHPTPLSWPHEVARLAAGANEAVGVVAAHARIAPEENAGTTNASATPTAANTVIANAAVKSIFRKPRPNRNKTWLNTAEVRVKRGTTVRRSVHDQGLEGAHPKTVVYW